MTSRMWQVRSESVETTMAVGKAVARCARGGDIVALSGLLGTGKTQFVRGLAEGLGVDPMDVASPTFVLVHEYEPAGDQPVLVHIDAYRISCPEDLMSIGWEAGGGELVRDAVVVIEWAERFEKELGEDVLTIHLAHVGIQARTLTFRPHGDWCPRMMKLRQLLE